MTVPNPPGSPSSPQAAPAPVVRATGVTRVFSGAERDVVVLRGVDLQVESGESVAIFGPSGSGKTTLLHCLGALDVPTEGQLDIFGRSVVAMDERDRAGLRCGGIGFVFQVHHLLPQLTAMENVLLPTLADGAPPRDNAELHRRARDLLDRVGLAKRERHRPGALSVGEQARVALARALVNDPRMIIADEPTGSLDRASARSVAELLDELRREAGVSVVVATHDGHLAQAMDRRMELVDGVLRTPAP